MPRPPAPQTQLRDVELLIRAHHPILFLETIEDNRAQALLEHVADHLTLLFVTWTRTKGLEHVLVPGAIDGTDAPLGCLQHITKSKTESLYYLGNFVPFLDDQAVRDELKKAHAALWKHRGAIIITGAEALDLPPEVEKLVTTIKLAPATDQEYHAFLSTMLADIRKRQPVAVEMTPVDMTRLLQHLRGLTFFEVRKVMTLAIAENWKLDKSAIDRVLHAKQEAVLKTGVLEYTPSDATLDGIAGLTRLKDWLTKRRAVFADPARAKDFGLSPPRGLLLLGVPGCGKSLSAKAVGAEFHLPIIRLDPARLYTKYVGETERNLRRAIKSAEAMAPVVLWIDEIEKAFSVENAGGDAGVSQRIFGTFLSWLQDKSDAVFVIATCNDVTGLPPELLRKGRFDEIFFVDLPDPGAREAIFALHLERRKRDPEAFDLAKLSEAADGFSGAEIEQAIVSALYAAYASETELSDEHILEEMAQTQPLSVTMAEKVTALREWAGSRAVPAD